MTGPLVRAARPVVARFVVRAVERLDDTKPTGTNPLTAEWLEFRAIRRAERAALLTERVRVARQAWADSCARRWDRRRKRQAERRGRLPALARTPMTT